MFRHLIFPLLLLPFGIAAQPQPVDLVVGTINGEPISASEYRLVMGRKVAMVYDEFKQVRNLEDHPGYWSESSGTDSPLAKLRELTREELVRIKVCQGLAKRKRLIEGTTFADFQSEFDRENARRVAAKQAGQVVYGPTQYRLATYYYIRFGDLAYKLKQSIALEAESQITENEIKRFYAENSSIFDGKPLDDLLRKRILSALAEKHADAQLEAFRASANVELKSTMLRGIVPRNDPGE